MWAMMEKLRMFFINKTQNQKERHAARPAQDMIATPAEYEKSAAAGPNRLQASALSGEEVLSGWAACNTKTPPTSHFTGFQGRKPGFREDRPMQHRQQAESYPPTVKVSLAQPLRIYRQHLRFDAAMIFTRNPQAWTDLQRQPLHERILPLPAEVRDFVLQVNQATGLDAVPQAVAPNDVLRADLRAALTGMPNGVLDLVAPLLLGICLGRNLGSSGATDIVVDGRDGRILGCIVLLDVDLMAAHTANSWATWKDNLPFLSGPGFTLDTTIADPHDDTRANALQFLLLHEFGHVLTADGDFLPRWWESAPDAQFSWDFSYLALSWTTNAAGRFVPQAASDFDLRGVVDFYGNNKLDGEAIVMAYAGLELADFASLYGATNPYDDFAECFATYVHVEMMGKPHVLRIDLDGAPQAWLESFWANERSAPKRAFMERMFGIAAPQAVLAANEMLECAAA
jgi:hypothetical protein